MTRMFPKTVAAGLVAVALITLPALAASMVDGDVEKVDAAAGKITLKHGPIPDLDMGEMSMVYRAQDPALLKGIKPGDKVKFEPAEINGAYTVTKIQKSN